MQGISEHFRPFQRFVSTGFCLLCLLRPWMILFTVTANYIQILRETIPDVLSLPIVLSFVYKYKLTPVFITDVKLNVLLCFQ